MFDFIKILWIGQFGGKRQDIMAIITLNITYEYTYIGAESETIRFCHRNRMRIKMHKKREPTPKTKM